MRALVVAACLLAGCGGTSATVGLSADLRNGTAGHDHAAHGPSGAFEHVLVTAGPRAALTKLREDGRTSWDVASACHHHAHELGRLALAEYGFDSAMRARDDLCVAGYVHGLLETYIGTARDLRVAMRRACGGASARTRPGDECYHGVGHGLMNRTEHDRPASLVLCASYGEPAAARACSDGVWMAAFAPHLMTSAHRHGRPESGLDATATLGLCREQPIRHKESCYRHGSANAAPRARFAWCRSAERPYVAGCTEELGAQLAAETPQNPLQAEARCQTAAPAQVSSCIEGMTISYFPYFSADPEPGRNLCSRLRPRNRPACRRKTGELAAYLCPPRRRRCMPARRPT